MNTQHRNTTETPVRGAREFQLRHNARIYVGEFSAIAWAPGADRYLRDCADIFAEYGWDWTYHAFREWEGWSVEHDFPPRPLRRKGHSIRGQSPQARAFGRLRKVSATGVHIIDYQKLIPLVRGGNNAAPPQLESHVSPISRNAE